MNSQFSPEQRRHLLYLLQKPLSHYKSYIFPWYYPMNMTIVYSFFSYSHDISSLVPLNILPYITIYYHVLPYITIYSHYILSYLTIVLVFPIYSPCFLVKSLPISSCHATQLRFVHLLRSQAVAAGRGGRGVGPHRQLHRFGPCPAVTRPPKRGCGGGWENHGKTMGKWWFMENHHF